MKLRNFIYTIFGKPKPQHYGYEIKSFDLAEFGQIEFAYWLHPTSYHASIELADVKALQTFLNPGDFCIDIGAHIGDTTVPMALAVGKEGCVLALEPNQYVYPTLEKNASLNSDQYHIIPLMAAASANNETLTFEYSDPGFCNGGLHEGISWLKHGHIFLQEVKGIRLADKLKTDYSEYLPNLKYIKLDTEGYDLTVLHTLEEIIQDHSPYLRVEIYKHTTPIYRQELYTTINQLGYTIYKMDNEHNYRGQQISELDMAHWPHYDIFCEPTS